MRSEEELAKMTDGQPSRYRRHTAQEVRAALDLFVEEIGGQHMGLAFHEPAPDAIWRQCFSNVSSVCDRRGGGCIFGWTFQHKISPEQGEYLVATHHAVWHRPGGALVDVTPMAGRPEADPTTIDGSVLFLVDDNAEPMIVGNAAVPLPLRYFPITDSMDTMEYIASMRDKELAEHKRLCDELEETRGDSRE